MKSSLSVKQRWQHFSMNGVNLEGRLPASNIILICRILISDIVNWGGGNLCTFGDAVND